MKPYGAVTEPHPSGGRVNPEQREGCRPQPRDGTRERFQPVARRLAAPTRRPLSVGAVHDQLFVSRRVQGAGPGPSNWSGAFAARVGASLRITGRATAACADAVEWTGACDRSAATHPFLSPHTSGQE